jgi:hypothetical protein
MLNFSDDDILPTYEPYRPYKEGEVYILDYGDGRTFKIGCTTGDAVTRFKQISRRGVIMPMRLLMSGWVPNCFYLEQLIHMRFAAKCVQGEWFRLSYPELVEIHQLFEILGDAFLWRRWYELFSDSDDHRQFVEHDVVTPPHYPRLKPRKGVMPAEMERA